MKVVITGATSFIGVHLIQEWLKEDCEIFAVVRPNSTNIKHLANDDRIHIVEKDMKEYYTLSDVIDDADCFYHLAWEGARAPYRDDKNMQVNTKSSHSYSFHFDFVNQLFCQFYRLLWRVFRDDDMTGTT